MGTALTILAWVGGVIGAVVLGLLKDEATSWLPRLNKFILSVAVNRMPSEKRERSREEWAAHVDEYPGKISQLFQCLKFLKASDQFIAIDAAEIDRNLRYTGYAMILLNISQYFTDGVRGLGFWPEHIVGFVEFLLSIRVCIALWWMIRFKPQILRRIGQGDGP